MTPRASRALTGTLLAGLLVALTGGLPASAQDDPAVGLTVSALTGVLGEGSAPALDTADPDAHEPGEPDVDLRIRLLVENSGPSPVDQLRTVIEIYPAAASRDALQDALTGDPSGSPLRISDEPVREGAAIEPGDIAGVWARFPRDEVAWAPDGGVHPLRIAVVRGTEVLAETTTAVVWLGRTPAAPLRTTFVWPVDSVPTRRPGGVYEAGSDRTLRPGGRVEGLVRALELAGDVPVTPAWSPTLLEELQDRADGFDVRERGDDGMWATAVVEPEDPGARLANDLLQRIRRISSSLPHRPIVSTYANADLDLLFAADADAALRDLASIAAADAPRRLGVLLDEPPNATTHLLAGPLPTGAIDLFPAAQLVVPPHVVDDAGGPAVRRLTTPAGRAVTALIGDERLAQRVSHPSTEHGEPIAVQNVIADTAMLYFEDPDVSDRGLVVVPSVNWNPRPSVASAMTQALADATWLDMLDPATLALQVPASRRPVEFVSPEGERDTELADEISRAHNALDSLVEALPADADGIDGHSRQELSDTLLRATSRWHANPDLASDLVRDVTRVIDATFGTVTLDDTGVTLTSDAGQIPVTLERSRGEAIVVRVDVASPGRLAWPEGRVVDEVLLEPGGRQTISFATRALSTGTFPVTVRVTDPSGRHELARTTLSVRSTAISRPALAGIGGIVVVLLALGVIRGVSNRPRLAVVHAPADPDDADGR